MALEKKKTYDYEVRGEYKCIQERCKTSILEDGKEPRKFTLKIPEVKEEWLIGVIW